MMINTNYDSNTIINYIARNSININTYLPSFNGKDELPLIYLCVTRPDLEDLFKYMIKNNVDLNKMPYSENPTDILIYSDIRYVKYLANRGCKLNPCRVYDDVYNMIIRGSIKKFLAFIKYELLTKDLINYILNKENITFDILDKLYEKISNICRIENNNVYEIINELLTHYIDTFRFFFNNGISTNIKNEEGFLFGQNVLNTYLFDLIKLLVEYKTDFSQLTFYHHSNFSQENKIVMAPIYNTDNFKKINHYLSNYMRPKKFKIVKSNI